MNLREIFLAVQKQLLATLEGNRDVVQHPGTKGDASELEWKETLGKNLPLRYQVSKAFVMDSLGNLSQQIDLVIHDRQYSPLLLNQQGAMYVPAESVYAVLEVKQDLNKGNLEYAGQKAASVRKLFRTSAKIPHAGGRYRAKRPFRILAGFLSLESQWKPVVGQPLHKCLAEASQDQQLDLCCALRDGTFEVTYDGRRKLRRIEESEPETALMFLFVRLLARLQEFATVPAIDWNRYGTSLRRIQKRA